MDERHDLRKDAGTGFPLHKMLDVIQQIHERERVILHLDAQIDLHLRIGVQPGEKPKDFKKSIKKLMSYIGKYKAAIFVVMFFAACSTIFNVAGPKILGKATTALS